MSTCRMARGAAGMAPIVARPFNRCAAGHNRGRVDAPDTADAGAAEPGAAARRLDVALLLAALALALALGLLDVGAPWENGFKGTNGGAYTYRFLQHHLQLGLALTRGACVKGVDPRTHALILS